MAYKIIRSLIRVDCTPIIDTKTLSTKLRAIEGFDAMFSDFNFFKIGDTSNYRNGLIKDMEADEMVYRYSRQSVDDTEYVFDFTSRFFYIRLMGKEILAETEDLFRIIESATRMILEEDKFVKILSCGVGKEFEELYAVPKDNDEEKESRDAYTSQPENVRILYQRKEQKDAVRYIVVATVNEVTKNPNYQDGEQLFDQAFMNALKKAEEKYGQQQI